MQAVGGRIESAVGGQAVAVQPPLEPGIGHLVDQAAETEVVDERRPPPQPATSPADRAGHRPLRSVTSAPVRSEPTAGRHSMPNPYLQGNFAPVHDERSDDHPLPVTGVLPPDLDGRLLRNGPNPAAVQADADYHWFSGDGMVHAISLAEGKATGYRNRWVRTRKLAGTLETPPPTGPERADRRPGQHPRHPPRGHHPGPVRDRVPPRSVGRPRPGPDPRLRRRAGLTHDRPSQTRSRKRRAGLLRIRRLRSALPPLSRGRRRRRARPTPRRSTYRVPS